MRTYGVLAGFGLMVLFLTALLRFFGLEPTPTPTQSDEERPPIIVRGG